MLEQRPKVAFPFQAFSARKCVRRVFEILAKVSAALRLCGRAAVAACPPQYARELPESWWWAWFLLPLQAALECVIISAPIAMPTPKSSWADLCFGSFKRELHTHTQRDRDTAHWLATLQQKLLHFTLLQTAIKSATLVVAVWHSKLSFVSFWVSVWFSSIRFATNVLQR